jgi:hypothetical protein
MSPRQVNHSELLPLSHREMVEWGKGVGNLACVSWRGLATGAGFINRNSYTWAAEEVCLFYGHNPPWAVSSVGPDCNPWGNWGGGGGDSHRRGQIPIVWRHVAFKSLDVRTFVHWTVRSPKDWFGFLQCPRVSYCNIKYGYSTNKTLL